MYLMLTVKGKNRTGIVRDVSEILYQQGVSIMDSSMTTLRSDFVMMLMLEAKPESERLRPALAGLQAKGLAVFLEPLSAEEIRPEAGVSRPTHAISVIGPDQTGIVYRLSQVLVEQGVNITDVNTQVLERPEQPLYAMILEIRVPAEQAESLDPLLQAVAQELGVDLNLHEIEFMEM